MSRLKHARTLGTTLVLALLASGCGDDGDTITNSYTNGPIPPAAGSILAMTETNILLNVSATTPGSVISARPLVGLQAGEGIRAIDYRPADKNLYGYSTQGRLYRIDPTTGVALQIGTSTFSFSGSDHGFDFDPMGDRARFVTDDEINSRVHPTDAGVVNDTPLAFASTDTHNGADPAVVAVAYSNSVAGASTTTLYGIDRSLGVLVRIDPPNSGTVQTVGPLGVATQTDVSLDIAPNGTAYAAIHPNTGLESLYTVNLTSGTASLVGTLATGATITGIAVVP